LVDSKVKVVTTRQARLEGVYPPSFCRWRLLLAVVAVTQLSVLLLGLGRTQGFDLRWLLVTSVYAQGLGLTCAMCVCITRAWLARAVPVRAWIGSWFVIVIAAFGFSYFAGVIGTVLGWGPGRAYLTAFMLISVLSVALVAMALLRYLYMREQWRSQLIAQAEARVQALQARIRPHFLFNSLNTIASLVPEDPAGAERAIEDLADIFRGSMRRADRLISLSDELRLARRYLDMEQRRLGDRLQVDWDISELPDDAAVLPLILQPLLENAVGHGVQTVDEGGTVRVYGCEASGQVVITISNPLAGVTSETGGHGMALRNIRERLELAFGGRASLVTQSDDEQFFAVLSLPRVVHSDH
jgi:two-component system sensor histidine kinase AlgZ